MENTLVIRMEAFYSLNYLVYLQNIYLNNSLSRGELKFPYIATKCDFPEDFEIRFKKLWVELSNRIAAQPLDDLSIFVEEKDLFYKRLFSKNDHTLNEFNNIYESFKVWWGSFAGRIALERSIDEYQQKIYFELANSLTEIGIKPRKELNICLLYDECLLVDVRPASYFHVLAIRDFFVRQKGLVQELQLCIF